MSHRPQEDGRGDQRQSGQNPVKRKITFAPTAYGLSGGRTYQWKGRNMTQNGDIYTANIQIPGFGHTLIEIT